MLVDEQLICGLQVHVGVSDRDLAVEIAQRVAPVPPCCSPERVEPFWNGQDTGLRLAFRTSSGSAGRPPAASVASGTPPSTSGCSTTSSRPG